MNRAIAMLLGAGALSLSARAGAPTSSPEASAVADIRQLGRDMGDAMVARDLRKIDRIFGDDWVSAGTSGRVWTKQSLLDDVRTGKKRLTWFELQPIDVQVFGDTAIAQGKVAERRMVDGQEIDMELVYADILRKRQGHWVVVQSMGARIM